MNLMSHSGRPQPGHHVNAYSPPPKYPPPRIGGVPFDEGPYEAARSLRYRELPPHRMPHFEDEIIGDKVISDCDSDRFFPINHMHAH